MKFIFYTGTWIERWDYTNPDTQGIGGSETSQIEMSIRLAKRGHEVISYVPLPDNIEPHIYKNVEWRRVEDVDWSENGIWIIYRTPLAIDNFKTKPQQVWLVCQDTYYPESTFQHYKKFDKVIALCPTHKEYILETIIEEIKSDKETIKIKLDNVVVSSNGIKVDLIREIEAKESIERNPKRLIWTSSPDRGLQYLLPVFKKARMLVPDLELHIFYGFDNIDKMPETPAYKEIKESVMSGIKQSGVYWHGRKPQKEIYKEFLKSGIWCYLTNFSETSCIGSMESQALGAIPITNPVWALKHNVMNGIFVEGNPYTNRLVQSRYLGEIIRLATNTNLQDIIRADMIPAARARFNWERMVDQWEGLVYGYSDYVAIHPHLSFARKYATGKILNVGCGGDNGEFKSMEATNLDVVAIDPTSGCDNKADIVADARQLPEELYEKFDTVVVTELLEHMSYEDGIKVLENSKKCLKPDGRIIITFPLDTRETQPNADIDYTVGCHVKHRLMGIDELLSMLDDVELDTDLIQELDYSYVIGWGLIARKVECSSVDGISNRGLHIDYADTYIDIDKLGVE
jgi:glycosyltransferase involved in cell wall biosynthesis